MEQQQTLNQEQLTEAIVKAIEGNGPMTWQGRDLLPAVRYVERVVRESFAPNYCDPADTSIGTKKQVTYWASRDYTHELLQ